MVRYEQKHQAIIEAFNEIIAKKDYLTTRQAVRIIEKYLRKVKKKRDGS